MNFIPWLKLQVERKDSVGNLARNLVADRCADIITGHQIFHTYLIHKKASDTTVGALDRAFREYHKEKHLQRRRTA